MHNLKQQYHSLIQAQILDQCKLKRKFYTLFACCKVCAELLQTVIHIASQYPRLKVTSYFKHYSLLELNANAYATETLAFLNKLYRK